MNDANAAAIRAELAEIGKALKVIANDIREITEILARREKLEKG